MKPTKRGTIFFLGAVMLLSIVALASFLGRGSYDGNGETPEMTEPEDLRISIITDIDHCPSRTAVSEENLDTFLRSVTERESDIVISLGDNASHRLRDCSETADADAAYVAERLRSAGVPAHFVLGDHDIASSAESYRNWLTIIGRERPFYSFDAKNTHIIVLDTVTGGEPLVEEDACGRSPACAEASEEYEQARLRLENATGSSEETALSGRSEEAERRLEKEMKIIHDVRSWGRRDRGMILGRELEWLKNDLAAVSPERIIVFSDHPLFPFESDRKAYDIMNGQAVRDILEPLAAGGKRIVSISGEAHLWHDETRNGIDYHIIDEFKKANGSWAFFSWKEGSDPALERILSESAAVTTPAP